MTEALIVDSVLERDQVMQLEPGDLLVVRVEVGTDVNHVASALQKMLPHVQVMVVSSTVELAVVKPPRVQHFVDDLQHIVEGLG